MKYLAWLLIPVIIFLIGVIVAGTAKWAVDKDKWYAGPLYWAIAVPVMGGGGFLIFCAFAYPLVSK